MMQHEGMKDHPTRSRPNQLVKLSISSNRAAVVVGFRLALLVQEKGEGGALGGGQSLPGAGTADPHGCCPAVNRRRLTGNIPPGSTARCLTSGQP
jgi:hypothetical protein